MTLLEMRDKRALLIEDNIALVKKAEKESRKLTADEEKEVSERKGTIISLEGAIEIEEEKRKVDTEAFKVPKMEVKEKRFSFLKALRDQISGNPFDESAQEVFKEGRSQMIHAGVESKGRIVLPVEDRAAIVTGQTTGTTLGGYIVQTDKKTVLPPLTNYLVLTKAGASYLTGLVGNVSIPTYSGTTVLWAGEVVSASDGAGTWGKVDMNPKRLTAYIDVSEMFLRQDSVGAEAMLMENISKALAVKLESTILGVATGTVSTQPAGLFYGTAGATYKAAPKAASWGAAVDLMKNVDVNNALTGNLGFVTHPSIKAKLMQTAKVSSSDSVMVSDGNNLIGYPLHITSSVAYNVFTTTGSAGLIFGNWADLLIGQWGGVDIIVDPYTQAALGSVRILINGYFDAASARSESFSAINVNF